MSLIMRVKNVLRQTGYDIIRYHPFWDACIKPLGIRSILYIGANVGVFSKEMRTRFPDAAIYAFEPLPECFAKLEETMHGDDKFFAYQVALGSNAGTTTMEQSSFHPSSSLRTMSALHKELYPKSSDLTPVEIRLDRLDAVLSNVRLETPLLIKMDVQGYEDEVIKGGHDTMRQASALIVETSFITLYEKQPLFDDIYRSLTALGFSYRGRRETHYNHKTDMPIYEDSLFIRN